LGTFATVPDTLVEATWQAVKTEPLLETGIQHLTRRKHTNDVITVIARKLLVIVWHVLTKQEPYRQYSEERIAYKSLTCLALEPSGREK